MAQAASPAPADGATLLENWKLLSWGNAETLQASVNAQEQLLLQYVGTTGCIPN